jgi:hypothetical protein
MVNEWTEFLPPLRKERKPKAPKPKMPDWCKQRYIDAHQLSFSQVVKDAGHAFKTKVPKQDTNGLQQTILKFLLWNGHRASRISSAGRYVAKIQKWIPGPTRSGSADISATIKGRSVMLEAKVDLDTPGPDQLREQELERRAGGVYEFVKSFEQFLVFYDELILNL